MASAGPDKQQGDIYIYKAMDQSQGFRILKARSEELINLSEIKERRQPLWLLRESSTQKGMLTADYIQWNNQNAQWEQGSMRVVLHKDKGWVNASIPAAEDVKEAIKHMENVDSETAVHHLESLSEYFKNKKLVTQYRMNPAKVEQTNQSVYSGYVVVSPDLPASSNVAKVSVPLTPPILQAITCELSGKIMKEPVVMKADVKVKTADGHDFFLRKGRSYEKSALEKLNVNRDIYVTNFTLSKVISRLGCNDEGRLNSLEEERLIDPVPLETMSNPYIMPTGRSISKETLDGMIASGRTLKCPETNIAFRADQAVRNINLDRFISAWPSCREILVNTIKDPALSASKAKL